MRDWWWWSVWIGCIIPHYSSLEECTCRKWSNLSLLGNLFTLTGVTTRPRPERRLNYVKHVQPQPGPGQGLCIWLGDHLPLLPSFYIINPHTFSTFTHRHSGYSPRMWRTNNSASSLLCGAMFGDEYRYLIRRYFNDACATQADKYSFIPG